MLRRNGLAILLLCVTTFCAIAWSQTTTGSMRGVVTDTDRQPLAGATVIISSKALIGQTRSSITNELGVFRLPSLPVGIYSVEARLDGFQSVRAESVEVSLGSTAIVPFTMKLSRAETVTVAGETPMIDPQNAGVPTIYKQEMVENLTTRRHMWVLMQVAPGLTVDYGDSLDAGIIAFGSNRQSNSWHIDGLDVTAPETGKLWLETNPDIIEQIQVYGIGTPAEYGNHTGAVINVITKKGSNNLHGAMNSFFQSQALTGVNVRLPDSDFVYHRDQYHDVSGQVGGPIVKDRAWFYGAVESSRDAYSTAGSDPNYAPLTKSDRYDLKLTTRFGKNHEFNAFFHDEKYDYPQTQTPYITNSALGYTFGSDPAWGATLASTFNEDWLLELGYAGWWGHELFGSQTGSLEDPYWVYPDNTFSGGVTYPYDYTTYRHQVNGKATYYADHFLRSQHEFKFGAQYAYGSADTSIGLGPNGTYTLNYFGSLYEYSQTPFHYGTTSQELGLFVDDTVTLNNRLTLNLGLRFDHNTGSIPDYDRLTVGTPSITEVANFKSTGQTIPGIKDFVRWNMISPRLGFAWQTREDGRAALRGSFGVYYDHNTTGNWDSPPPAVPPYQTYYCFPNTSQCGLIYEDINASKITPNKKLKPPRALQYSIGYEFQPTENSSIGVQYVKKDTNDLIGWQFLGGEWESFPFTDPFTGRQYTMISQVESSPASLQKGNDPGDFPGSEGLRYFQKYQGVILTLTRRFADAWALNASYTWSKSYGLIPRMLSQRQFDPFYGAREGNDPNNYVNATGRLQGDRPHMFRAQVVFFKLPWNLQAATSVEFSSGRPYSRQIRVHDGPAHSTPVIMESPGSLRHSPVQNIDLSIGKRIALGNRAQLAINGQILNLLNSNQELAFATLVLQDPSQTFVPVAWVQPRRLQVLLGLQF